MRDIRSDLKERLESIDLQRSQLQKRLIELQELEKKLNALLEAEDLRINAENEASLPLFEEPAQENPNGKYSKPAARFVLDVLKDGEEVELQTLKRLADRNGIPFGGKSPGRSLHFLLMGMAQNGVVERTAGGRWKLAKTKGEH